MAFTHIRTKPYRLDRFTKRIINRDAPTHCGAAPEPMDTDEAGATLMITNFQHIRLVSAKTDALACAWVAPLCPTCLTAIGYTITTTLPKPVPPALREVPEASWQVSLLSLPVVAFVGGYALLRLFG